MTERDHARDAERLPEEAARRLLARASELDFFLRMLFPPT